MSGRRLSFFLISPLLSIALGLWIVTFAVSLTVGKPEQTRDLLAESGIYEAVIPEQIANAQQSNPALASIPLDDPRLQKVFADTLDSSQLESEGGKAVDAIYAWLEGKSESPQFTINVQANQDALAAAAGEYAAKYAASLPVCAPEETGYVAFSENPLAATCMPQGASPDMVNSSVRQSLAANPSLTTATQLNEEDVLLPNGKTVTEAFEGVPGWYETAQLLPLISIIAAALLTVLLLVFLKLATGTRAAGKHFLAVGITMALVAILLTWGIHKLYETFIPKSDNPNVADALMELTSLFNNALRDNLVRVSLYAVAAGLAFWLCGIILKKLHAPQLMAPKPAAAPSFAASVGTDPVANKTTHKSTVHKNRKKPAGHPHKKPLASTKKPSVHKKKSKN